MPSRRIASTSAASSAAPDVAPRVGVGAHERGRLVGRRRRRIARDVHRGRVARFQERQEEVRERAAAETRRHVADPQLPARVAVVGERGARNVFGGGVARGPRDVLGEHLLRVHGRVVVDRHQQIAVGLLVSRIERQRRAIVGDRLRRFAEIEAGDTQRVADVGALRRQVRRLLEPVDRFRQPCQPVERNPGEVGSVGIVRHPLGLPREPAGGLGVVAILVREPAELATDAGIGGAQRAESLPRLPRVHPVAALGFRQREIEQRRREIGVARERRAKCGDRGLQRMLPAKHFAPPGTRLGGGGVGGFGALRAGSPPRRDGSAGAGRARAASAPAHRRACRPAAARRPWPRVRARRRRAIAARARSRTEAPGRRRGRRTCAGAHRSTIHAGANRIKLVYRA